MRSNALSEDAPVSSFSSLPDHLSRRLRAELRPGESITWAAQPNPSRHMKSGFKLWYFFIPWTAFALFWIVAASGFRLPRFDEGWSFFPLFGFPFLLIGLGGLSAPIWLRRKAHSIVYALTNQRAITIEGSKSITVKYYMASDIVGVERTEHQDGSGDIVLKTEHYRDSDGDSRTRQYGFFAIDEVRKAERLVEALIHNNHA
jgi:hypothetical protein